MFHRRKKKEGPEAPRPPKKKRFASLRREFNDTFVGLRWKDARGIAWDTIKDLRHPREILKLAGAAIVGCVVPGFWIGYGVYRIRHYRQAQKAANDNIAPKPSAAPDNKPPSAPAPKPPSP